jgi:osmotically-inducible protein OsmY
MKKTLLSTGLIAIAALTASGCMADSSADSSADPAAASDSGFRDARLTGQIETMYLLNPHLSAFAIDTDVENGIVHLNGTVSSDIDRDLAGALAKNVDGVVDVDNELEINEHVLSEEVPVDEEQVARRDFGSWVDDTTTTAAVKSRLIGNANTKGLQIDVDTRGDIVTLSGRVETAQERELAEQIARDAGDVADVHNNLVVDPS